MCFGEHWKCDRQHYETVASKEGDIVARSGIYLDNIIFQQYQWITEFYNWYSHVWLNHHLHMNCVPNFCTLTATFFIHVLLTTLGNLLYKSYYFLFELRYVVTRYHGIFTEKTHIGLSLVKHYIIWAVRISIDLYQLWSFSETF